MFRSLLLFAAGLFNTAQPRQGNHPAIPWISAHPSRRTNSSARRCEYNEARQAMGARGHRTRLQKLTLWREGTQLMNEQAATRP